MVDLDELDRLHASLVAAYGRGYPRDEVDTTAYALSLLNAYPALAAEVRALREVVAASRRLTSAQDACDEEATRPSQSRSSAPMVRMLNASADLRAALAKVPR